MKAFARPWARLAISFLLNRSPDGERVWVRFKVGMRFPTQTDSINSEYFNYFQICVGCWFVPYFIIYRHIYFSEKFKNEEVIFNKLNSGRPGISILKGIVYKDRTCCYVVKYFRSIYFAF